jgi:hypothetical protein
MEQPCHRCGQAVEQGVPFCPHCSAPQIRVIVAETPAPAILPNASGAAALPSSSAAQQVVLPTVWSASFRSCALAALLASLLVTLGLYPIVAMLSVGFLAVVLYRQRWPGAMIRPGIGVRLGALSGLLWFAISSIVGAAAILVLHKGAEVREQILKILDQVMMQTTDVQARAMLNSLRTPSGLEVFMIFALIVMFFASILFGIIGGALGGALLGRRDRK